MLHIPFLKQAIIDVGGELLKSDYLRSFEVEFWGAHG